MTTPSAKNDSCHKQPIVHAMHTLHTRHTSRNLDQYSGTKNKRLTHSLTRHGMKPASDTQCSRKTDTIPAVNGTSGKETPPHHRHKWKNGRPQPSKSNKRHERKSQHCYQSNKNKKNRRFRKRNPELETLQVINLSTITLTKEQKYVLSLGPKFCPTPGPVNELQLSEDVHEGSRRLRLAEFFHKENGPAQKPSKPKFYKKSGWEPPSGRDKALDAYCASIESLTSAFQNTKPIKKNLNHKHRSAIYELKHMVREGTIRISPADKGGAIVVQDLDSYKQEAYRQLNNVDHYQTLTEDPTKKIAEISNTLVDRLKSEGIVEESTHKWAIVNPEDIKTHTFYHLPKIHKDINNPPGRPIVSGINGPTEKLSKLVDHFLQPIVQALPSTIKDTTHFLQVIEEWNVAHTPIQDDVLFVTIDVIGLYANIPHEEVEISIKDALSTNHHLMPLHLQDDILLDMVKHVLENNVLQFEKKIYKQTFGTAMGTPMAPTIANIFMGWMEKKLLSESTWEIPSTYWRRFIDDIALLWTHGEEELKRFLKWINTAHPSIKFTAAYGTTDIAYLDVNVSIIEGRLETDLHQKETDTGMCLPFHSCHPRHCTRGIPYSQCLRLRRICSKDTLFRKRCDELKEKLRKRGYPIHLIDGAIHQVGAKTRHETLRYVAREPGRRVPFVVTHNPQNPPLSTWLKNLMPVIHSSMKMKRAVPLPPIVGERNCPNLKRILMPSALPSPAPTTTSVPAGCCLCEKRTKLRGCTLCRLHMMETTQFNSVVTGSRYKIQATTACTSANVIYLLDCRKCHEVQYVGETGQTMKKRFDKHRSDIKTGKPTLVARHFCQPDHNIEDMICTVIEAVRGDVDMRKRREKFWRWKLRTNFPQGLNVFD